MAISGADRALVNLKLANDTKLREHSFMLAEAALQHALTEITKNPELLNPATSLIAAQSENGEIYRVFSLYHGLGGACDKLEDSSAHHYELIAIASTGDYASARHAIGVSVCEFAITDFSNEAAAIVAFTSPARTYWRTITQDEAGFLLPERNF